MKEETCKRCGAVYVRISPNGKSKYCCECKVRVAQDRINTWKRERRKSAEVVT